jgi:hypothetical protein
MRPQKKYILVWGLFLSLFCSHVRARPYHPLFQTIDEYEYYPFTPCVGDIITQTQATARFQLFGNRKGDRNGDGIDDRRHENLLELASYFSPVVFKNSKWSPESIRIDIVNDVLRVDTWNETQDPPDLINSTPIDFQAYTDDDDARVRECIEKILTESLHFQSPERAVSQHMYFNLAGNDEKTWHKEWDPLFTNDEWAEQSRGIYVHPFIHQDPRHKDRYEFILQYWFYYPYNDAANNHEGDWEHINVSLMFYGWDGSSSDHLPERFEDRLVKDPQSCEVYFTSQGIQYLVQNLGEAPNILKELTVKRIDYYFHHSVTFLYYWKNKYYYSHRPYRSGNEYNPVCSEENITKGHLREFQYDDKYESEVINFMGAIDPLHQRELDLGGVIEENSGLRKALDQWIDLSKDAEIVIEKQGKQWLIINNQSFERYRIRKKKGLGGLKKSRMHVYELRPGIHPKVFVGGENQGYDQMKWPYMGIKDSVSGGNYPFPGLWQDFTGFYSREKVNGAGGMIVYKKEDLSILPDWECIPYLEEESQMKAEECKKIRQEWSWLILPIRWGYPSVPSPLRSVTKGFQIDLGDNGAVGPAYNNNWNRIRDCKSYEEFNPLRHPGGERRRIPPHHYYYQLGLLNIFSSLLRFIPVIDVVADRPLYKGFPPLWWFLGIESPEHVFSNSQDTLKLERFRLMERKEIYAQGMGFGAGRFSASGNLAQLILVEENIDIFGEKIDHTITKGLSWGTSIGLQFNYFLEHPPVRIINQFQYQEARPLLDIVTRPNLDMIRDVPITIGIYTIDIAAEPFMPKTGHFRFFPRLGIGYSLFHIQDMEGIGISVEELGKRTIPSLTFNGGAGLALHMKSFELQARYIAYLNFPKVVSYPIEVEDQLQNSYVKKRINISRHLVELKLAFGW